MKDFNNNWLGSFRYDLCCHLKMQKDWSNQAFGPGLRTEALTKHIAKELEEIKQAPTDTEEWADVVVLGFEGALRAADGDYFKVCQVLADKMNKNLKRNWPDWRNAPAGQPIEHIKT